MTDAMIPDSHPALALLAPGLTPIARRPLAAIARLESRSAGAFLLREDRPTDDLGVVVEGRLSLRIAKPGHPDVSLMTLDAGDLFGWSAVLDGISTASIVALGDVRVLLFARAELLATLAAEPAIAIAVYRRLLEVVASRLDATRLQSLDLYRPALPTP